jgi:predicted ATPase/DNA-binding SARP family transcriptional activator
VEKTWIPVGDMNIENKCGILYNMGSQPRQKAGFSRTLVATRPQALLSRTNERGEQSVSQVTIRLLGPFLAERDGQPLTGFRSAKVRALLAYLCVESHRPWPRATLAYLLWPDFTETTAQNDLRNALSNLRHVLGDAQTDRPLLLVSQATLQFNRAGHYWLDVQAFLDLLPPAGPDQQLVSDQAAVARLEEAVALYRGDFLEGLALASPPFEQWLVTTREHLRLKLLQTVRRLALAHAQLGNLPTASDLTRRWVELEPWEEAAHRHLMQLLALRGQRSAALAQYEACRQSLAQELGIDPEPETVRLVEQIRDGGSALTLAVPQFAEPPGRKHRPPGGLPSHLTAEQPAVPEPTLFVARHQELEALGDALVRAAGGRGCVRFVTGEPGSGKTALLVEFARRALAADPELLVAWGECSAFTGQGDPYFPFLTITRMLAGEAEAPIAARGISPEAGRRLWQQLPTVVDALIEQGPDLINRFLSGRALLALAHRHSGVGLDRLKRLEGLLQQLEERSPQLRVQQAALFDQLTQTLCALAQRRPLLLILDDMQWIDPGSVDLLFHLARGIAGSKILLVGAYRPEEASLRREAEPHPLLDVVGELQTAMGDIHIDLMQSEAAALVAALIDSEPNELSGEFRAMLCRRTSGNPLFTIELLRGMQLRGEIRRNRHARWVEGRQLNWNELPARVEAVIARRIGHLSPACRELLSAASVEGEQFTAEVVADVRQQDVHRVTDLLSREAGKQHRLVSAQMMRPVGGRTLALYRFRHALFQTYLYQQLDVVEKARLHGLIALKLEEAYRESLDRFPEITHSLARHFEAAGRADRAVHYYQRAGKHALRLSAHREAIAHFDSALRLLQTLPASSDHDRQELDLQLSLGPPLTASKGWAPPEMEAAYGRAQELCEQLVDHVQLIPALWLLATFHIGRSEHTAAIRLVERLVRLAQQVGDPDLSVLATLQVSPYYQGRFAEARRLLERAGAARDVEQQRRLAQQYGIAPAVVGLAYLAECLWLTGLPDRADDCSREARELAEAIQLPMVTCYAIGRSCWLAALRDELEGVHRYAATLGRVAQEYGIQNFALAAQFFTHWAAVQGGTAGAEGITSMAQAMEAYRATGTVLNRTGFLALFGRACGTAGQVARGLAAVDESLALAEETGELWFQAIAWRIKGELLGLQAKDEAQPEVVLGEAEACLQTARRVAAAQGAKALLLNHP